MPTLSFYPGLSSWMLVVLLLVVTSAVALCYRQAFAALRRRQWMLLFLLRMSAIGIVVALLFRPILSFHKELSRRKALVFLLDRSASMRVADSTEAGTRWDQARMALNHWWESLGKNYEMRLTTFADTAKALNGPEPLARIAADGPSTSLTRALLAAKKTAAQLPVDAVVLVTDGNHNAVGNPINTARRLGLTVYTVGVGDPLHDRSLRQDVRVMDIDCPDQLALNNRSRITAFVEAAGVAGRVVPIRLLEDDVEVDKQELALDDIEGAQELAFEFVPENKGLHTYTVNIPVIAGEKVPQNNSRSTSALVHDAQMRVLYIEGTLRSEYGALVGRFLAKDPNIEFCALVQTRPNMFVQRTNIEGLELKTIPDERAVIDSFDVFMIGDLDSTYMPSERLQLIRDRVTQGAGLIMIGGYHSLGPGGYGGTVLEELLPVDLGTRDVGQALDPFAPVLTADGRRHPIFANIEQFFPSSSGLAEETPLPDLSGCVKVLAPRSSATILLTHPTETVATGPMPVMAIHPIGKGRAAVFTADTTRHWQQSLESVERESPFVRFWGQTIRWLAGREEEVATEPGVIATTDKAYYEPDEPITLSVTVRGEDGAAAKSADVVAILRAPGKHEIQVHLAAESGPDGNYRTVVQPPGVGRCEILVSAKAGTLELSAEALEVDVGRPYLEFDQLDLDEQKLVAMANESGGRYLHVSLADRLTDWLQERHQRQLVEYEVPLAWPPLLWCAFVGVLSAEWLLRRRYQLR